MSALSVQLASHGSLEFDRSVQLRREVLRWPLGLDFSPEELASEKKEIVLVAYKGDDLVGTLNLAVLRSPDGLKMRQVAVRPDEQGKGVGRALVEMAEQIAIEAGSGFIKLHARDSALEFYTRLGYATEGEPFEEVGIPHRLMFKNFHCASSASSS